MISIILPNVNRNQCAFMFVDQYILTMGTTNATGDVLNPTTASKFWRLAAGRCLYMLKIIPPYGEPRWCLVELVRRYLFRPLLFVRMFTLRDDPVGATRPFIKPSCKRMGLLSITVSYIHARWRMTTQNVQSQIILSLSTVRLHDRNIGSAAPIAK